MFFYQGFSAIISVKMMNMNNENGEIDGNVEEKGIGVVVTAIFIVGMMAGSGILALPMALVQAGWVGIPMLIICGILSTFTGTMLGNCWTMVRDLCPEYRNAENVSDPYPIIGYQAAGKWGRSFTRASVIATQFGAGVVYLLLISGNIASLINNLSNFSFPDCYWILVVTAVLTPMSWLGTPKDFWWTALIAFGTTTVAAIFVVVNVAKLDISNVTHAKPSFVSFFNSFGTILYAFGGSTCFPTLQVDMKEPHKFSKSVFLGLGATLLLYVPVSVAGFVVFGDVMSEDSILDQLSLDEYRSWLVYPALILMTIHLLMAFVIIINPVSQDIEGLLGIRKEFCWQRCLLRTINMGLMLFVGLSIPHFGIILSLVGGVCTTATNFIFPPLFYMLLLRQQQQHHDDDDLLLGVGDDQQPLVTEVKASIPAPLAIHMKILMFTIILIGCVGGVASLYSVFKSLVDGSSGFTVPCYVNMTSL